MTIPAVCGVAYLGMWHSPCAEVQSCAHCSMALPIQPCDMHCARRYSVCMGHSMALHLLAGEPYYVFELCHCPVV